MLYEEHWRSQRSSRRREAERGQDGCLAGKGGATPPRGLVALGEGGLSGGHEEGSGAPRSLAASGEDLAEDGTGQRDSTSARGRGEREDRNYRLRVRSRPL
jgi:hypothetical protein